MYTPVKHEECSTAMTPIRHASDSTQYTPIRHSTQSTCMSPISHNVGTTQVTPVKCEDLAVGTIHFESHDTGIGTTPRRTIESHTIMTPKSSLDTGTVTSPISQVCLLVIHLVNDGLLIMIMPKVRCSVLWPDSPESVISEYVVKFPGKSNTCLQISLYLVTCNMFDWNEALDTWFNIHMFPFSICLFYRMMRPCWRRLWSHKV